MKKAGCAFVFGLGLAFFATAAANAMPCRPLPAASAPDFLPRLTRYLNNLCYQKAGWTHDAEVRTSDGVHPFVKIWYSPQVFTWMTTNQRNGPVPNGAGIVKEMYAAADAPLTEWTVMIKDSDLSWDGWYWGDLVNPSPSHPNQPSGPPNGGCGEPQVLLNGA